MWKFDTDLVNVIKYADNPENAPDEHKKFAQMLNVVRVAVTLDAHITDTSLADALELVNEFELSEDLFLTAVQKLQAE